MDALGLALLLATANKALLDYISAPLHQRFPGMDLWWFDYVALVTGFALGYLAGLNIFSTIFTDPLFGRVLTALVIGGGTTMLNLIGNGIQGKVPGPLVTSKKVRGVAVETDAAPSTVKHWRGW